MIQLTQDSQRLNVTMFVRHPTPGWHSVEQLFSNIRQHLPPDINVSVVTLRHLSKGVIPRLRNIVQAWRARGDINHVTGDVHYIVVGLPRARTVLTVLDLVGLSRGQRFRRWLLELLWYRIPVAWSTSITTISQFTADELQTLLPRHAQKTTVIENPLDPAFANSDKGGDQTNGPVICFGTTDNKNLGRIAEALDGSGITLRIIGHLSTTQRADLDRRELSYENLHDLSIDELIDAYSSSSILLFPSLYEGFGMPIIEAQSLGLPVITSDREPMRSVGGDGALLIDPESAEEIRTAVERLKSDSALREELVAEGLWNSERFSPHVAAERYAEVYRRVASGPGQSPRRQRRR